MWECFPGGGNVAAIHIACKSVFIILYTWKCFIGGGNVAAIHIACKSVFIIFKCGSVSM